MNTAALVPHVCDLPCTDRDSLHFHQGGNLHLRVLVIIILEKPNHRASCRHDQKLSFKNNWNKHYLFRFDMKIQQVILIQMVLQ